MKKMAIAALVVLSLALPAVAGEKANPYQVFYSINYQAGGVVHVKNAMNVDITITIIPSTGQAKLYSVPAGKEGDTNTLYNINNRNYACVAPARAFGNQEPGNEGFVCHE